VAGMTKFKFFGPKVCCFGPRRAFGAAYGGCGWETVLGGGRGGGRVEMLLGVKECSSTCGKM
jgi:hypothetical protein